MFYYFNKHYIRYLTFHTLQSVHCSGESCFFVRQFSFKKMGTGSQSAW